MEEKGKITDENLMKLSLESIKFFHESMKERLKDLIQTSRDTTERSYKLISIYIGLLTFGFGYLYANLDFNATCYAIITLLVGIIRATYFILLVLLPRTYMPMGRNFGELQPNEYANGWNEKVTTELQQKLILRNEIISLNDAIETQHKSNIKRVKQYRHSLNSTIWGIVASTVIFILFSFL